MLKKLSTINSLRAAFVALAIGLVGCGNQATSTSLTQTARVNENLPQVVATTSVLCDLTQQVAKNTINLTCLIPPGTDPHIYQPKPEDRQALEQANLILYNGYNLEPRLIQIIKAIKSPAPKIAVGQLAVPKPQKFREDGNIVTDPHIWHDAKNAIRMVEVINSNLGKLEPNNVKTYSSNTKKITNELTQIDRWIKLRIASIPTNHRRLVTNHNALGYYAKAYGLSLAGALEGLSTKANPTTAQVKNLAKNVQRAKVTKIFSETSMNSKLIKSVGAEAKVRVSARKLYTDGIGEVGSEGENYQRMMVANTRTIVEGLGGTYLIFEPKASQ
ncbi:MAG: zinc ABC transporter substrate-binding protein [Mojavia pulchra JT2-VF2]|uniref:Zinc ABC transporter substrate-binding protein n=1 Tax=Mojavia pulchra JT2-VF2 TaxID=287848 RepID=A0A951PV88_9NOST|nr:zinc ABC transporter substrate-binding protein [Mojavia pulchra JT2-VF2]